MKLINTAIITTALLITTAPAFAGDAAAGKAVYNGKGCIGCHGAGGGSPVTSNPPTPSLAGQSAAYLKHSLTGFKSGTRQNPTMNAMAAMLGDADIDNVATYLSSQK